MAKPPKTRSGTIPISYLPDRDRWQLTIHVEGKRKRTFHKSEAEALKAWKAHCDKLRRFGTDGTDFGQAELSEYREAKRIVTGADLRDVAAFWRAHHPEGFESVTVADAARAFLEQQESKSLSKRHLSGLRKHVNAFAMCHAGDVRSITGNNVLDWLRALRFEPRTVRNYAGSLSAFFAWCRRRGLVTVSPADSIHDADLPQARPKAKGVLTVDQCAALMDYLAAHRPKYVPWHALQLFAGIRRAEVGRLRWDWIDLDAETITLPGWVSGERIVKTGDDWVLHDLPANLWAWLRAFPGNGRIKVPGNDTVESMRQDEFPKVGIPVWPKNALRHTFCTMMMSLHGDAAKVATWSRHTNASQLYKSYVAKLVTADEAKRFCSIVQVRPPG